MKGLLKLSTVALSAAMVAGMSTPVFAAGASVGGTPGTTINVTDVNGNVVATTKSKDVTTFDFAGSPTNDSGLSSADTNDSDDAKNLNVVNVRMTVGDVKKLTATASDNSTVKWAFDTDALGKEEGALDEAKKSVTVDDGTITVTKDAKVGKYKLLAYIDSNKKKDDPDGKLTEGYWVTVNVEVKAPKFADVSYVNADSTYTQNDNVNFGGLVGLDGTTDATKLPKAKTHSAQEFKASTLKNVNHVALGESAAFKVTLGEDDADYNTLLDYTYAVTNGNKSYDFSKSLKATTDSNANSGKVSVVGTVTGNGLVGFNVVLPYTDANGNDASAKTTLYVIADSTGTQYVYRVYNPNSGEHFYTTTPEEVKALEDAGWQLEKIGWIAPTKGAEVYRVYNKNTGEHHYTTSAKEKNALVAAGWTDEGVAFHSATKNYTPVYREYNKNAFAFNHNYTTSLSENNMLVAVGWKFEGTAFYALGNVVVPKGSFEYAVAADQLEKDLKK